MFIKTNNNRESGIELLKVFALFGIVLVHTYTEVVNGAYDLNSKEIFFENNTFSNLQYFLFQIIIPFGYLGNMIFYVCSSWFLVDIKHNKKEKIIGMILNTFVISIIYLLISVLCGSEITKADILNGFLPTTHMSYWYITCYILMYLIYPLLNILIENMEQRTHFLFCLVSFSLYFVFLYFTQNMLLTSEMFINKLLTFIIVYIIVAYMKIYKLDFCNNIKKQIYVLLIAGFLFYLLIFINFAFFPINIKWHEMYNPFFLLMSFSLLNIFRKLKFKNKFVNSLSSLSLFIYIFHSNNFYIETIVKYGSSLLLTKLGINFIFIKVLLLATISFVISACLSVLYNLLFGKIIGRISMMIRNKLEVVFTNLYMIVGE